MLALVNTETIILMKNDIAIKTLNIGHCNNTKMQFPITILLTHNILVELIGGNYDIKDGIVNGVEGIFRQSTTVENGVISIKFSDPKIGVVQ